MSTMTNTMSVSTNVSQNVPATSSLDKSPKAAARPDSSSNNSNPKDKSFSSIMDKANDTKADADTTNPPADDANTKTKITETKEKTVASEKTDPASSGKTSTEAKKADTDDDEKDKKPVTGKVTTGMSAVLLAALQLVTDMPASQTKEPAANSIPTQQPTTSAAVLKNLDALLPQNSVKAGQAVQNQQLLEMLSSNSTGTNSTGTIGTNTTQLAGRLQQQVAAQAMAQVQGTAVKPAAGAAVSVLADAQDKKAAIVQTVGTNSAASAGEVLLQGMAVRDNANATDSLAADKTANSTANIDKLLPGVPLTVENKTQQNQSGLMQQHTNSGMGSNHQQPVLQEVMQLPEEAQFDVAPAKSDETQTTQNVPQWQPGVLSQLQTDTPAAATGTQAAASQTAPDYDVPKQIVEQAKLVKLADDTQMIIKLKPEHLGELTLKVSVSASGAVNASFHTDNAQVRNIIENSMVQLRQELQTQGLKVDHVGVYAGLGEGSLMDSHQQSENYQPQSTSARSQKIDMESFEEDADMISLAANAALTGTNTAAAGDGVDYRV